MTFPIEVVDPASLGFDPGGLERLCQMIEKHVAAGRYPGAQLAVGRHGKLALSRCFGLARTQPRLAAEENSLFLLYSNTKVIAAATIWSLVQDGALSFGDRIAEHIPGFERNRKGEITLIQLLTHQGGFPSPVVASENWENHEALRRTVCDFELEWQPGTRIHYHPASAHWVAAVLIESVTGRDFRDVIRERILVPLGIEDEVQVGLRAADQDRAALMYSRNDAGGMTPLMPESTPEFRSAGVPGGGGFGTARAMAHFYQMLVGGGALGGKRLFSQRLLEYVTRNFTGERMDLGSGLPMHRGLGPYVRGTSEWMRGLGTLAHPTTFGHGGAGSSQCWGDPDSGVSFAFVSNARLAEPAHDARMEILSNMVHTSIIKP
jgi:CubicO group peptidase (beta-lactamase class C family)